jgi:hypothetical protein
MTMPVRVEDDATPFVMLMERQHPGWLLRAVTGDEPMLCPRCHTTDLPILAYFNPEHCPHHAAAYCNNCMDGYGVAFIRWLPKPDTDRRRSPISDGLRWRVFERDGFRCVYCRRHKDQLETGEHLHADHVIPVSRGGETSLGNLVCACTACNLGKSNHHAPEAA